MGGGLGQVGQRRTPPIDDMMSKHKMHALALKPNVRKIFKSIDSGWINGNPGIFFPCAKRELITLFSKAPCRGGKDKCSEGCIPLLLEKRARSLPPALLSSRYRGHQLRVEASWPTHVDSHIQCLQGSLVGIQGQ